MTDWLTKPVCSLERRVHKHKGRPHLFTSIQSCPCMFKTDMEEKKIIKEDSVLLLDKKFSSRRENTFFSSPPQNFFATFLVKLKQHFLILLWTEYITQQTKDQRFLLSSFSDFLWTKFRLIVYPKSTWTNRLNNGEKIMDEMALMPNLTRSKAPENNCVERFSTKLRHRQIVMQSQ